MFRNRVRNLVLALSMMAALTGSMVPGSQVAAASVTPGDAATAVRYDLQPTQPKPELVFKKAHIESTGAAHNGRQTNYGFKVMADNWSFTNITVKGFSHYKYTSNDQDAGFSLDTVVNLGLIPIHSWSAVGITCNPPAGKYCDWAFVEAFGPGIGNDNRVTGGSDIDGYK